MISPNSTPQRITAHHSFHMPAKASALACTLALMAAVESLPGFMAFAEPAKTPQPKQAHDDAKPARTRSKIINNSEDGPTIHFTQCRENEKHHVSCQFDGPDGEQHWVYLAGYTLKDAE